jgi:serine protease DegQ
MRCAVAALLALMLLLVGDTSTPAYTSEQPAPIQVPYRISATKHIVVRAKFNGRGPYNLVLDTGAPVLVLARKLAEPLDITPDENHWADVKHLEIEGGVSIMNVATRFDDLYQLEGMNGLGLAGVEIHGLVGYPVLARYRVKFDFTSPKMSWTPLAAKPDELPRRGGRSMSSGGLDALAAGMKFLGKMVGADKMPPPKPRGFVGMSLEISDNAIRVSQVLTGGPADRAGIKVGEAIRKVNDRIVKTVDDFAAAIRTSTAGESLTLVIVNANVEREVTIELGGGL